MQSYPTLPTEKGTILSPYSQNPKGLVHVVLHLWTVPLYYCTLVPTPFTPGLLHLVLHPCSAPWKKEFALFISCTAPHTPSRPHTTRKEMFCQRPAPLLSPQTHKSCTHRHPCMPYPPPPMHALHPPPPAHALHPLPPIHPPPSTHVLHPPPPMHALPPRHTCLPCIPASRACPAPSALSDLTTHLRKDTEPTCAFSMARGTPLHWHSRSTRGAKSEPASSCTRAEVP